MDADVPTPAAPSTPPSRPRPCGLGEWLDLHADAVVKAEASIAVRLRDRKRFGEHSNTELCGTVFDILKQSLEGEGSETSSLLLLGEAGSGKTHVAELCLQRLKETKPSLVVLRAHGAWYANDSECARHLATQVADQLVSAPRPNATFEEVMEWMRKVLVESLEHASGVVVVLDRFETFCSKNRQTLLYNLFDIAQEANVRLSIIGMSERMDVLGMLEKRIKSRSNVRHLHTFLPETMEELVKVLLCKLRVPADAAQELPPGFAAELEQHLQAALQAKADEWQSDLEVGQPISWFLRQCLPLMAFLKASVELVDSPGQPAKRLRPSRVAAGGFSAFQCGNEGPEMVLHSLAEIEHIVLLALWRLRIREANRNLALMLHEIEMLYQPGHMVTQFVPDVYLSAFSRLAKLKLVEVATQGTDEVPKRYLPCQSLVDHTYATWVRDLERGSASALHSAKNPLRSLPEPVLRWIRKRASSS